MPKRENSQLESARDHSVARHSLELPLNIAAKNKLLDETRAERRPQKGECLNCILRNRQVKRGAIVLQRSQKRIRYVPDHRHCQQRTQGCNQITENSLPATPLRPYEFPPRYLSPPSNTDESDGKTGPQKAGNHRAKPQDRTSMLRASWADLRHRQGSRPAHHRRKANQENQNDAKVG